MRRKSIFSGRAAAVLVAVAAALSLAACGSVAPEEPAGTQIGINGVIYVPEYVSMGGENDYYSNQTIVGNKMYYSNYTWDETTGEGKETYYCKELGSEAEAVELPVTVPPQYNVSKLIPDADGNMYLFMMNYESGTESPDGYMIPDVYLCKLDSRGNEIFNRNITREMQASAGMEQVYVQDALIDAEGHIYATADNYIFLFDAEGNLKGTVQTTDWISSIGLGKDGKVYLTQWSSTGGGMELVEVDYEAKALGAAYQNFPNGSSNGTLCAGIEHDFIVNDSTKLVGYNIADQTTEDILDWLDSDINGQYVDSVCALEDGRYMAMLRDWETGTQEMAFLTGTDVSQVTEKEVIVIGVLSASQDLQNSAVKFNKTNKKYRIKIKNYLDLDAWTETAYQDSITAMNNEILAGNGPDLIDLSQMDVENLVKQDMIEDLTSYLANSGTLKREDFIQSVLSGCTIDGVLTAIPTNFYVSTVLGRTSQVGEEMGWSLDDVINFIDTHPEAEAFDNTTKEFMLMYCMMFNRTAFVDTVSGTCNFDSEDFKKVLEFANKFPAEYEYNEDEPSTPVKIMNGEILLNETSLEDAESFSVQLEMFNGEPVTCIGFPTVDGSVGNAMTVSNAYGILANSSNKEGAWEFIEYMLKPQSSTRMTFRYGFSTRQSDFDQLLENATKVRYMTDENGNPVLDEEGNPIEQGYGTWGWGDITIEARALTEAEADMLRQVVESAKPVNTSVANDEIMKVINEEAAYYFEGDKSVDEVADTIQRRVKMYISENM